MVCCASLSVFCKFHAICQLWEIFYVTAVHLVVRQLLISFALLFKFRSSALEDLRWFSSDSTSSSRWNIEGRNYISIIYYTPCTSLVDHWISTSEELRLCVWRRFGKGMYVNLYRRWDWWGRERWTGKSYWIRIYSGRVCNLVDVEVCQLRKWKEIRNEGWKYLWVGNSEYYQTTNSFSRRFDVHCHMKMSNMCTN